MSFRAEQMTLVAGVTQLTSLTETDTREGRSLAILFATVDIYLGGTSSVNASTGAKLAAGIGLALDLASGDTVYAFSAGGTIHLVESGV